MKINSLIPEADEPLLLCQHLSWRRDWVRGHRRPIALLLLLNQRFSYVRAPLSRLLRKQLVGFASCCVRCLICWKLLCIPLSLSNIRLSFCRRNRNGAGICRVPVFALLVHFIEFSIHHYSCFTMRRSSSRLDPFSSQSYLPILIHVFLTFSVSLACLFSTARYTYA